MRRVAIVGAGMAGLALARALVDRGVRDLVILDAKPAFADDRTWCWWDVDPTIGARALVSHRWNSWRVRDDRREAIGSNPAAPYVHLRADVYYADAVRALAEAGIVVRLNAPVLAIEQAPNGAIVRLAGETIACDLAIDARGVLPHVPRLVQSFHGLRVRADRPIFDPQCATLMDFDVPQNGRVRFMYVLPYDPFEALVEETVFGPPEEATAAHARIGSFIARRSGARWTTLSTERGCIPMDARAVGRRPSPNVWRIGTAAGAVRASSGYAFVRAQRDAIATADAVLRGAQSPPRSFEGIYRLLDACVLQMLASQTPGVERFFVTFAAHAPPDAFARFMCDHARVSDAPVLAAAAISAFAAVSGRMPAAACDARAILT